MVRMLAFVGGMLAGMVLLLVVVGASRAPAATTAHAAVNTKSAASASAPQDSGPLFARPVDPHDDGSATDESDPDDGTQVDLQGDEVTSAVARYRFDAQGNIYETHAPHTEVPRLGTPQL